MVLYSPEFIGGTNSKSYVFENKENLTYSTGGSVRRI
jgi:hypothetical protein